MRKLGGRRIGALIRSWFHYTKIPVWRGQSMSWIDSVGALRRSVILQKQVVQARHYYRERSGAGLVLQDDTEPRICGVGHVA